MRQAIYILDGMGPQAGGYLYNMLIKMVSKEYGARNNDDFPEIILHSIPVPDFISDNKSRKRALEMLKDRVKEANFSNISAISIACNTAHILLPRLQKESEIPFISIIEETVKQVHLKGYKKVGLLSTPSTIKYGLYQTAFKKLGISTVLPSKKQMVIVEMIIRNILSGKRLAEDRDNLIKIADSLEVKGAQAVVLGCTELPLLFPKRYSLPLYDCVEILSNALLRIYYGANTIQK